MPKPLSDDLRCRILQAYLRGEGSQAELSRRFGVSFEYVRKIRRHWRLSGRMERQAAVSARPLESDHGPGQGAIADWVIASNAAQ
jgi:transposase-like protein